MAMTVSFRGGESAGSVGERQIDTAKQETTGGVGARKKQDSIFLSEEPKCDTVCFRGQEYAYTEPNENKSALGTFGALLGTAAVIVGLLGLAKKYDVVNKYIKNEKVKDVLKYADKVTEPCYKACKWVKNNSYDKVVDFIKSKKS